ncbi:hypothetical protein B7494_g6630 [Chlorociboria aeruginascens]|nr:hypothetical protein B7494_g6630 [Chlorociboria aeruginascens]
MAEQIGDSPVKDPDQSRNIPFPMGTDDAFSATPIVSLSDASKINDPATKTDPTFMQNQISIQRSPSTTQSQATALSRKLSVKSNGSYDAGLNQSGIVSLLTYANGSGNSSGNGNNVEEGRGRGHERLDSNSSFIEATNKCSLKKSSSTSTDRSTKSIHSAKSVRSVHVVGSYPLGTLRLHSPSPTRNAKLDAHDCLKSGDVAIVRDIPPGSVFGYDARSFTIKAEDKFEGVSQFPAGAHFLWGGSTEGSLRVGFWIMSSKRASDEYGEVHIKRWDKYNETLEVEVSAAEIRIQKDGIPELFDKLQPYASETSSAATIRGAGGEGIWLRLTSSVKGYILSNITGHEWNHWQVASTHDVKGPPRGVTSLPDDPTDYSKDEVLNFVFPKATRTFSESVTGRDRTEQAMDTSAHIMAIIAGCTYEDSDQIIGELQFCYISGMTLGNVACMEQWANIIKVIFKAFRLALEQPLFFLKVIQTFHAQLIFDDAGIEGSIMDHDAALSDELKMILTVFKSRLNEQLLVKGADLTTDQEHVGKAFEELEAWLWKWNWDLRGNYLRSGKIQLEDGEFVDAELKDFEQEDERGEYAPVMVDIDEEGREKGLIRF